MTNITARAHTNIAFIKYWGKKDQDLFLPYNSSLSLTLDKFYTETTVSSSTEDQFYLNGQLQDAKALTKITNYLQIYRDLTGDKTPLLIQSTNHVPTAAGLASSSSAYAALALALNEFYQLNFDYETLSTYARRGSGSATRSLYGGFVEWQEGHDNSSSKAVKIDSANFDIGLLICIINDKQKKIPSRQGMQHTVTTSDFYPAWVETAKADLLAMKEAIAKQDVYQIGAIAEHNAMKMHATMLAANPPFTYFEPQSLTLMQLVQQLRTDGFNCHYTMDAGPNVKIIAPFSELAQIEQQIKQNMPDLQTIITKPGPDAQLIGGN